MCLYPYFPAFCFIEFKSNVELDDADAFLSHFNFVFVVEPAFAVVVAVEEEEVVADADDENEPEVDD
jgi:hypothetical protein